MFVNVSEKTFSLENFFTRLLFNFEIEVFQSLIEEN